MKPKSARVGYDGCATPSYALLPLLPYITGKVVWESAPGDDDLIGKSLREWGKCSGVISGAIEPNTPYDFFEYKPSFYYDLQLTNPPYSKKYEWLSKSYLNNKLFALLLPVETIGAGRALRMFDHYGIEVIFMTRRVNFRMPNKGWNCQAQFPVAWFTWKLGIGKQISIVEIDNKLDPLAKLA